jgi:hypothetical protein
MLSKISGEMNNITLNGIETEQNIQFLFRSFPWNGTIRETVSIRSGDVISLRNCCFGVQTFCRRGTERAVFLADYNHSK